MMINMFIMFDPSSSIMKLNWLIFVMILLFMSFLVSKNKTFVLMNLFITNLKKEFKAILLSKNYLMIEMFMISLFTMIMMLNLLSMLSYNFTINSQISISFPTAFIIWISMMLYGWMKMSKIMIIHGVPTGTPTILLMFMIMIEMISNLIRPITLSIRLTANMLAGHLLMSLLGNMKINLMNSFFFMPIMLILLILELAVSIIQAYVFSMLLILYCTEMN